MNTFLSIKNIIKNFFMKLGQIALVRMVNCEVKRISVEFEKYNVKEEEFSDLQKYDGNLGGTPNQTNQTNQTNETNQTHVSDLGFTSN